MVNKLRTTPRLTLVFIITLLISGSILTYFSINNISNFKELTQKKISEEEKLIVEQLSIVFREKLENITRTINDLPETKLSDSLNGIDISSFVIDKKGIFKLPWYIDGPPEKFEEVKSPGYVQYYSQAEIEEFRERDYVKSRRSYQSSLQRSTSEADSTQSLNALARVSVKLKQYDQAYNYYSKIISDHYSTLNEMGFPYSYFAIIQLLKLDIADKDSRIVQDISLFISMMESGKIPLNQSSKNLLLQLEEWISQTSLLNNEQIVNLWGYINTTKNRLTFISDYSGIIRETLSAEKDSEQLKIIDIYNVFRGISPDKSDLILSKIVDDTIIGFVLKLESFWELVNAGFSLPKTEFDYEIDLFKSELQDLSYDKDLTTILEFSSFFPSFLLKVELKNKHIVDEYVAQRSWIYGIALILLLGGMFLGITLILRDIRRERKMALLRADFVSNVTHELKTPLTSITMFAESIFYGRALTESENKNYSNVIIKESGNLKRMINNILTFSIREDGKLSYQFKETDLSMVVNSTLEEMNYWLDLHKFKVDTDIKKGIVGAVDPEAIKQVLANLINNAIKYSPLSKKLYIRLYKLDTRIYIEVEDRGIGIPKDQIPRIFDKFYRVLLKDTEPTSGTGIGLTVARDIIEAHGGTIELSSVLNEGSTFKIILNV
ncbi:ATP-binding protein [Bacteroidota bacterium]